MYQISMEIVLQTPLHIGAAAPIGTEAIRGMRKDQSGWPYIPASTFKGRLRHMVERLAYTLGRTTCNTHHQTCERLENACPVCRIFGSPFVPGQVRFTDLILDKTPFIKKAHDPAPLTTYRFGVALSRTRRVAGDGLLYTLELFQPGVPLLFRGVLEDIKSLEDAAWLYAGTQILESLGSGRGRGLGWISTSCQVREISSGAPISQQDLRSALGGAS